MDSNRFTPQYLDLSVTPTIRFVKSKGQFKLHFKDCFGLHNIYFDRTPINSALPAINEIALLFSLSNTTLDRCPKLNPKPVKLKLKSKPKLPNGQGRKRNSFIPLF